MNNLSSSIKILIATIFSLIVFVSAVCLGQLQQYPDNSLKFQVKLDYQIESAFVALLQRIRTSKVNPEDPEELVYRKQVTSDATVLVTTQKLSKTKYEFTATVESSSGKIVKIAQVDTENPCKITYLQQNN